MKKFIAAAVVGMTLVAGTAVAQVNVRPYFRNDGTYVPGHQRSAPDNNPFNNYSTRGNVNPWTGQPGTVNPYQYQTPSLPQYPTTPTYPTQRRGYFGN